MTVAGAPRARRRRSVTESLLSIALLLEGFVVFFVTLTVFGLGVVQPAFAFGGGAALLLLLVVATRVLRYRWGVRVGWVAQLALLATGLIVPAMFFVSAIFIGLWIFCLVQGRRIDRRKAQLGYDPASEHQGKEETA